MIIGPCVTHMLGKLTTPWNEVWVVWKEDKTLTKIVIASIYDISFMPKGANMHAWLTLRGY